MKELWSVPDGKNCAVNQVLYHVASRGIEYELLPWMREHHVPLMAYCPLAQGGDLRRGLYQNPVLGKIAAKHQATIPQVMLAFAIRGGDTIAIPRSGSREHTLENAAADSITLSEEELRLIDQEYPAPQCKTYLDIM
jgi:diketogulonate reductase-like aldo/keto reductase